jgi:uncharacterized protein YkwD
MLPGRRPRRPFAHAATATSPPHASSRHRAVAAGAALVAGTVAAWAGAPHSVHADASFDQVLFSLINQDRAGAGLPALRQNTTLGSIGENADYGGCGFTVAGRSADMIARNYFSHTICGSQNVFNIMQAQGVRYSSAGENIGWESGYTDPTQAAQYLNQQFMNSSEHRANILNPSFTDLGVGSWSTAPGQVWSGGGGSYSNVYMASEEFAQISGASVATTGPAPGTPIAGPGPGYRMIGRDGGVFDFEGGPYCGSMGGRALNQPIVAAAPTRTGNGYWMVAADGGIFSFGDAQFHGSMGGRRLNQPIVGMAATPDGGGYWLVARDGGIFAFGDAPFRGSMGGQRLNRPIVAVAPTSTGSGYWLVASDGGVFAFGDAPFHGSMGGARLVEPVVGMAATGDGGGYWMVAADGGIFSFGDAGFHGSVGGRRLASPMVGMARTPDSSGYWMVAADGGVFAFNAPFHGSTGGMRLASPMAALIS